jgi:lipooligosaccharide transport system ATP-binding protein
MLRAELRFMASPIVVARALCKQFGDRPFKAPALRGGAEQRAVDGLDLDVHEGECFGLLGPNGAGKTTTLRMVYGVVTPTSGSIHAFGLDVARHGRAVRQRLGVTLQENVLVDALSPIDNLRIFGRYHLLREPELSRRIEALIDDLELRSHAHAPAETLSGGFKRRLAIAMSLINDPQLLILDEPTTGLDPAVRLVLWNKVRELRARGKTVLLTTHYMEEAERLCDRVAIMAHGKAVCAGRPRELIAERLAPDVLELDCDATEERELLAGRSFKTLRSGPRLFVFGEQVGELVERVKQWSGEAPHRPYVLRPANLEDLFLAVTGTSLQEGA